MRFILVGILFSLSSLLHLTVAQVPGYQGKHFTFSYDLQFFNALRNPNANQQTGISKFNVTHVGQIEWVHRRKGSLGFRGSFLRTADELDYGLISYEASIINKDGSIRGTIPQIQYGDDGSSGQTTDIDYILVDAVGLGLFTRKYLSKSVAPLGTYFQSNFDFIFYKVTPLGNPFRDPLKLTNNFTLFDSATFSYPDLPTNNTWYAASLGFDLGRQRFLFDKISLRYGARSSWILLGHGKSSTANAIFGGSTTTPEKEALPTYGRKRLKNHMLFNLYLGIGFLAG